MARLLQENCLACNRERGWEMCRLCDQLEDAEERAKRPRVLLIGQAPSADGEGAERAFSGRSGERLAALAGLSLVEMLDRFDTANLFPVHPGRRGQGDAFSLPAARLAALDVEIPDPGYTVFVGTRVKDAFADRFVPEAGWMRRYFLREWAPFEWTDWVTEGYPLKSSGFAQAWMPHPSGIVRWWNDPGNCRRASAFLRDLAGRCGSSAALPA